MPAQSQTGPRERCEFRHVLRAVLNPEALVVIRVDSADEETAGLSLKLGADGLAILTRFPRVVVFVPHRDNGFLALVGHVNDLLPDRRVLADSGIQIHRGEVDLRYHIDRRRDERGSASHVPPYT